MNEKNIYYKIVHIRNEVKEAGIKKSGFNKFQKFKYLELADFIPLVTELLCKYNLYSHINMGIQMDGLRYAIMSIVNIDDPEEQVEYYLEIPELSNMEYNYNTGTMTKVSTTKQIQDMGKLETYCRRYLYMLFLDMAVPDTVDKGKKQNRPQTNFNNSTSKQNSKDSNKSFDKGYEEQVVEDRHVPRENNVDVKDPEPLQTLYNQAVNELTNEKSDVTKSNLRVKASSFKREGKITATQLKDLIKFINETEGLEP